MTILAFLAALASSAHAQLLTHYPDSASAPGFSWNGNSTTGIYAPSPDTIALTLTGTERTRFTTSGISTTGQLFIPFMTSGRADNTVCWQAASGRLYQTNSIAGCLLNSDSRLKKNITPFPSTLAKLLALRPVSFHWKDNSRGTDLQLGFIAQEVHAAIPEITYAPDTTNTYWRLAPAALIPYLVKGVQEIAATVKTNSSDIDALKAENAALKQRLTSLESHFAPRPSIR